MHEIVTFADSHRTKHLILREFGAIRSKQVAILWAIVHEANHLDPHTASANRTAVQCTVTSPITWVELKTRSATLRQAIKPLRPFTLPLPLTSLCVLCASKHAKPVRPRGDTESIATLHLGDWHTRYGDGLQFSLCRHTLSMWLDALTDQRLRLAERQFWPAP